MKPARRISFPSLAAVILVLALMAGTSVILSRMQRMIRLGKPGIKLVQRNLQDEHGTIIATNAVYFPEVPGYTATNLHIDHVVLDLLPRDTTFGRTHYQATNGFSAMMNAVLMGTDRTSIHRPEICLVGQGLRVEEKEITSIEIREPIPYQLPVTKLTATAELKLPSGEIAHRRLLYVYWFVADGQVTAAHTQRMASMAWGLMTTGELQRWAYISCLAECDVGREASLFADMQKLIAAAVPQFQLATGAPLRLAGVP